MRRFSDWFIWIPLIALMALLLAGLLYSLIVGEPQRQTGEFIGK